MDTDTAALNYTTIASHTCNEVVSVLSLHLNNFKVHPWILNPAVGSIVPVQYRDVVSIVKVKMNDKSKLKSNQVPKKLAWQSRVVMLKESKISLMIEFHGIFMEGSQILINHNQEKSAIQQSL